MNLKVLGVDVFYKESGAGELVLFLHGNPDSADIWDEVIAESQKYFRCLAIDLPGFGRSVAPRDFDCSVENLGRFIHEFLRLKGISDPVSVVAHDFGGAYAMSFAIANPGKVKRMVSINHPFFVSSYKWHIWARIWRIPFIGEYSMITTTWPAFKWVTKKGSANLTTEQIRNTYSLFKWEAKRMALKLYRAVGPKEFEQWEPRMLAAMAKIPTLVLWGEKDPWIPSWVAEKLGTKNVIRLEGSGHAVPAESAQKVSAELLKFLGT
jgi:pimeloyl-ACP methyl ester carboxylesterase